MKKLPKKSFNASYLKLFKQSLALSFSLLVFGANPSYATTITGDSGFKTDVTTSGNTTDIKGGITAGNNTNILHFFDFNLSSGDIANFIFTSGVNKYVGLVDTQIIINGILNAIKNGKVGGDVMFVSPEGMLVGQSGIVNVGSLQLLTPNVNSYNSVVAKGSATRIADINKLTSDSTTSDTQILGKIFSTGAINLADANRILLGQNSDIVSGFSDSGFAKTRYGDLSNIVNTEGIVNSQYMSGSSGSIKISSKSVTTDNTFARTGTIQSTGSVSINTPNSTGTEINLASKINAGGNVTIGNYNENSPTQTTTIVNIRNSVNSKNGDISINGNEVMLGEDANVTATGSGGNVSANTVSSFIVNSDITADSGIAIKAGEFEQGENTVIKNNTTGDINIDASTVTQNDGASIVNDGQNSNIIIKSTAGANLQKVTLSNAANSNNTINISAGNLTLNDEITSNKKINIDARSINQTSNDFTSLNAGSDVTINSRMGDIGSDSQAINMSAAGEITLDAMGNGSAYIHGTGDNNLTIAAGNNLISLDASSDKGINITGNIISNGDVNLDATTGINQNSNTNINSYTGSINLSNSDSGDITTGSLTSSRDSINISNSATDGSVNINNNISANNKIIINSNGGIEQTANTSIINNGTGNVEITNSGSGDVNLKDITNSNGNIILKNDAENTNLAFNNITGNHGFVDISSKGDITQTGKITAGGTNIDNNSSVNINAQNQASLGQIQGPNDITVNSGNVVLNNLINASSGNINITAENDILQNAIEKTLQASGNINLNSTTGDIGSNDQRIVFSTDSELNATAGGGIHIKGENTNIDLSKINAGTDYDLATSGDGEILINGAFNNANGSIELETEKTLNITDDITAAGDITLTSDNGIIQTEGTNIESGLGNAQSGNINITNNGEGGITINSATANKGGITLTNAESATGDINAGNLTADSGDINISNQAANGNVILNNLIKTDSNIEISANKNIIQSSTFQDTVLDAQNNIELTAQNGSIGSNTDSIKLNAGNVVNAQGTDIYLESPDANLTAGLIKATNTVKLSATDSTGANNQDIILTDLISGTDIDLNASGSILQNTIDAAQKVIDAQGNLSLTAQNGSIGESIGSDIKAIGFSAKGNLSAEASNGSIALNGVDTDIDTSSVNAGTNLDLITTNSGKITVSNEQNVTGHINLNSAENIELNKSISATDDITLSAKGDITQGEDLTGTALTSQKDVNITAANAGTQDKAVIVDAQGAVNVGTEDFHAGNIYLEDNTGDMTIGQMYADNNLSLKAEGNIIQQDASKTAIISGGNVTLSSNSGNVGASDSSLKLNITGENASFNVEKSQNVYVESPGSDLNTGNINADGTVNISTTESGSINLSGLINANDVTIHAIDNIIQNTNIQEKTINTTGNLTLISDTGSIGSSAENGGSILFSSEGSLSASAQEGSVYLNGIDTTINTTDIKAKNDIDLKTTGSGDINVNEHITAQGHIKLDSAQKLNLSGNLTANDYIDLAANNGDIILNSILNAQNDISLNASGSILQDETNNSTVLNAGKDINLTAGANIGSDSKTILLNSDGTVNAKAGDTVPIPGSGSINITSANKSLNTGIILGTDKIQISATGQNSDINLTNKVSGKDIDIHAGNNIVQNIQSTGLDRSIEAQGSLNLTADNGSIGQSGNAIEFSSNSLSASAQNGSVVLSGIDTDINTQSIKAGKDIDLTTENSGKITVSDDIVTDSGYIRLNSAEMLELNDKTLSAGKYISLGASGGIIQDESASIISGTNASSTAEDGYVSITNKNGGQITLKNITSKGDVTINNEALTQGETANGDITLGKITSSEGSVSIYNNIIGEDIILEDLISSNADITLNTTGDITHTGTGVALDAQNNISLDGANIGSDSKRLTLNAGGTVGANADNIYLESTKDLTISGINSSKDTANGTVDLKTTGTGNIKFQGLVKGGNVNIESAQGISQDQSLNKAIDASSDLTLIAKDGSIGSKDTAQGGAVKFSANGSLLANASEAVVLDGIDTDINTSSITAGTDIDLKTTIDQDDSKGNIFVNNELKATNGYVSLDSAKGLDIKQNITASEYVKLNAANGNIDIASNIAANSYIDIDANGNITQNSGNISAKGQDSQNIGISINSTNGDISLGNLTSDTGKISIENSTLDKDVILNGLINATANDIEITSLGKISQTTTDTALATGNNIILNAQGDIGSDSNSILMNADGTIKADGSNIYLGSKDKNLNIAGINKDKTDTSSTIKLTTETGNIHISDLIKGENITLDSAQGISQDAGLQKSIDGENITLNTKNGSVGSDGNAIDIAVKDTGKVNVDSAGDVYLNSPEGSLTTGNITANNHKVDINSSDALKLDGLISANDVILKAVNDITQDAALEKSINANTLSLTSSNGNIGEPAQDGSESNAIDFSATGSLSAIAQNGSVVLNGVNTSINTDSVTAGHNIDISTTGAGSNITVSNVLNAGGYIRLNSAEGLILDHNLNAQDYISLAAQKDILLNSILTAATDINIDTLGNIIQDENIDTASLNAGRNIALNAGQDIGLSSKSIILSANGSVSAQGQNIYLDSTKDFNISSVTSTNNGTIKLSTSQNGNIHLAGLVKGGDVTIDSSKGITQDSTLEKSIEAENALLLNAADGDIGEAQQGDTPANAIDFTAGSVEAHADRGSVVLNGVESDINTNSITALNNIDLTTTNSGKITVSSALETQNGYINLDSADGLILNQDITSQNSFVSLGSQNGDIILNSIITAATDIEIDTQGNIIQQTDQTALNAQNNINISAAGNAGSADNSLLVNAGSNVNANAQNIYLQDNNGDFIIGDIIAQNDVKLTADGNLIQSSIDKASVQAGGNAYLISKNGDVGTASNALKTDVKNLVNADAQKGSVYLRSDNDFKAGNITAQNTAQINSNAGINLNGLIKANTTNLTAENDITQATEDKAIEATGGNINLVSNNGNIGTPNGTAIGFSLQGSGVVNADAQNNGSVVLKGIDSNINTSTIKAKNDIDLTTTGSGNITVSDNLNAGGYIKLDSANDLTLDKDLTASQNIDLYARNGNISIGSILDAGTDINLNASGSISQSIADTVLNADRNISLVSGSDIGSDIQSILLNAGGTVSTDGTNIYLTSPNADFNTGIITAAGIANINTTGNGSITTNDNISANQISINSSKDININKNITSQNGITVNAQGGIEQNTDSTLSTESGTLSITANNGDLNLSGAVSNKTGSVSIANESTGDTELNVNKVTAGTNFDIRHEGNGMLNINGLINNNGNSSIVSNNEGENAGLSLKGTINNNKGTLNIESNGQQGTQISGAINNDLINDSSGAHTDITIRNHNGALNITSSKIDNGKNTNSQNTISIINDGDGGLNINSNITNKGILSVTNNAGEMNIAGAIAAEVGSQNTFTNGSANDFVINSNITNKGTTLTFNNTGNGNLVLGKNALLTVYSVLDNGTIYTGTLNLNNSGTAGNIQIDGKISGLAQAPSGSINIENTSTGVNSGINFGENASIDAKSNEINITNNGGSGIQAADGVNIASDNIVSIDNTLGGINFGNSASISGDEININNTSNTAGIIFGDNSTINSQETLDIYNNGVNGGITFGENANITAGNNIAIENHGNEGISLGNNAHISSDTELKINNEGNNKISFGDQSIISSQGNLNINNIGAQGIVLGNDSSITSNSDLTVTNTGTNGISFGNQANVSSQGDMNINNSGANGISFGDESNVTSNANMTVENTGNSGFTISDNTILSAKESLKLTNTGSNGISINGTIKAKDVNIENKNSNINIAHNKTDGNIIAEDKISINIENGNLFNSSTEATDNKGLVAGKEIELNVVGGSIGVLDSTLNSIIQNGFVLDSSNAINISTDKLIASADNDINIRSNNENLNIETLSAKNALLASINGAINADKINTDNNLYLYAKGSNGSINVNSLTTNGKLTTESDYNTTINSESELNADSMLSKNGSISINSEGNTYINEIAAANDISINVEDEKLTITTLGRVDRDQTVVPKTVNLTVKDAKRPQTGADYKPGMSYDEINNVGPNSKLDIYHAYVQDKVTMKADTITAQVYDISDGAVSGQKRVDANGKEATGFHNANKNGNLLEFDIQGANYSQSDVGSDPNNPYYTPDENDKHALNVHLTIGDSVDGAEYGANFKKLYSDYAFIDTVGSDADAYSTINVESAIIGEKAIFRNNKYRVDVNNTDISQSYPINIHYNDETDAKVENKTSFNLKMSDKIEVQTKPDVPIPPVINDKNDPNKIVKTPSIDYLTQDPNPKKDEENKIVSNDQSTAIRNISWIVKNQDNEIIGSSTQIDNPIVESLVSLAPKTVKMEADKISIKEKRIKKGDILHISMQKENAAFDINGQVTSIQNGLIEIKFIHPDKYAKNIITLWCMEKENL